MITPDGTGTNIADRFLDSIIAKSRRLREMLKHQVPIKWTVEEKTAFQDTERTHTCHICKRTIKPGEKKVADHDHLTGRFRGPAHNKCNLDYGFKPENVQIPCFFHNLKHYDAHLIISAAKAKHGKIKVIPNNTENYISFSIGGVTFKDSLAFTQAPLDKLVANLGTEKLVSTRQWLENRVLLNDNHSVCSDGEEEEEPTESDLEFVDDRACDELSDDDDRPSKRKRHYVVVDSDYEDDDVTDCDDDDGVRPPCQQRRCLSLSDDEDDDDDVVVVNEMPMRTDGQEGDDELDWAVSDDEEDDDDDDSRGRVNDDDDGDGDDGEMIDDDYRRTPYSTPILSAGQKQSVEEDLKLLSRKGIYPYEYMDSPDKFKETAIPDINAFYSSLTGKTITEAEHRHAKHVFDHFGCVTLQDYHDLYLRQDVLLLNDVLIEFRKLCLDTYNLDAMHYYTAPGLTWDAGLKFTGETLQLLTEDDMFLFVEAVLRGGVSVISHRHAKANHPDLEKIGYYNPNEPRRQLLYFDANNLYGFAMCQYLPMSDFEWMSIDEMRLLLATEARILSLDPNGDKGYFLEVDLHYPEGIHAKHSDYPLASEKKVLKVRNFLHTSEKFSMIR